VSAAGDSTSDAVLDEIFGSEVDWRELVVRYPKTALGLALGGGLMLGLRHGPTLLAAISDALGERTASAIQAAGGAASDEAEDDFLDEELDDEAEG
jgi:hypothetical protein